MLTSATRLLHFDASGKPTSTPTVLFFIALQCRSIDGNSMTERTHAAPFEYPSDWHASCVSTLRPHTTISMENTLTALVSILQERRIFEPTADTRERATISGMPAYQALAAEAERDYEGFWARLAREGLSWHKPFTKVLDESDAPFYKWFDDGELNASYNCLDRHVEAGNGERVAVIFEADDGTVTRVTYAALLARVSRFANALKKRGIAKGDRVVIYMPMSIEGIVAMQACARIGATHSVVFGRLLREIAERAARRRRRGRADHRRRAGARRQDAAAQEHRR
ncbi:hypothetical protein ABID76_006602 [Burkholderia ambifaria]